jgi:hypothetical protein
MYTGFYSIGVAVKYATVIEAISKEGGRVKILYFEVKKAA